MVIGATSPARPVRRFEFAADSGAEDMVALSDQLAAAAETAIDIMQREHGKMAITEM
jgi:hypothetical protein